MLAFMLVVVSTPATHQAAFISYAGMVAWGSALAHIPLARTASRAALVLPFSTIAALGLPFAAGGRAVDFLGLRLSLRGLWVLAGVSERSFVCAAMLYVTIDSTGFEGTMSALRGLGVPGLLVDLTSLSWRYLHLLSEQAARLGKAAAARGFRPRWLPQASVVGRLAGNLFVRSYERAERVHGAMMLRGHGGALPPRPVPRIPARDLAISGTFAAAFAAARLLLG